MHAWLHQRGGGAWEEGYIRGGRGLGRELHQRGDLGVGLFLPATVWVYVVYLPWQLSSVRMVGVFLLVYIRQDLFQFVSDVESEMVQTGMLGLMVSVSMWDGVDV